MITIHSILISNKTTAQVLTLPRRIHKDDLEKYRRRLKRLYGGEVDFRYKDETK